MMVDNLPDIIPALISEEPTVDLKDHAVGLPKTDCSLLFTFELCENMVFWTAVSRKRKNDEHLYRGSVELGYDNIDELTIWFEHFWKAAGDRRHNIHVQVSGPELQQRSFKIPVVPNSELDAVVRSEAKKVFPFDVGKGLFGWKVIEKVDWAGGMKYHVYSLLLSENWNLWLSKLFGEHLQDITLVTANGQMYECTLNQTIDNFVDESSYLTRLRLNVVETAFFCNGHLEFYRELPVDSLTDGGTVGDLKKIVGLDAAGTAPNYDLVISELKAIMRDAIDYYHGQFGLRSIKRAYISMPSHISEEVGKYAAKVTDGTVVHLNDKSWVRKYCRHIKIAEDITDCSHWISILPCRKIASSVVNLVPESLKRRRLESRVFKYSIALVALVLLTISALTITGYEHISEIEGNLVGQRSLVEDVESSPALQSLSGLQAEAVDLQDHLSMFERAERSRFKANLSLLSNLSRENVRLSTVNVSKQGLTESAIGITGEVIGPNEKQDAELYMYVSDLRNHPMVKDINMGSKRKSTQLAVDRTLFSMEIITR